MKNDDFYDKEEKYERRRGIENFNPPQLPLRDQVGGFGSTGHMAVVANNSYYPQGTMRVDPSPGEPAMKDKAGKAPVSDVTWELVELLAKVRSYGAEKYSRDNFHLGFPIRDSLDGALRHIFKFLAGIDNDEESGLSHLGHAIANLEHAVLDMTYRPENDNRKKRLTDTTNAPSIKE